MASLLKPPVCTNCNSVNIHREFHPERWVCDCCNFVIVSRPMRNNPGKCRVCGIDRGKVEFKKGSNICKRCLSDYNRKYLEANKERLCNRRRILYRLNRDKRKESVRKAVQKSPEAFIKNLLYHIRKKSNKHVVSIDYNYLINLYEKQRHKCALSGLMMTFEFNNPRSISIDRIDSLKGYEVGNVQLVCQAFNWMKNKMTQEQAKQILDDYYVNRRNRTHGNKLI